MQDSLVRGIAANGFVKVVGITTTNMVERARQIHHTSPVATAALGRLLTAASIMGNMQKNEKGSLTLQIKGGGPLGTVLAVSDHMGNVRGYVDNPDVVVPDKYRGKLDVGAAVGTDGTLTVIRDLRMKDPYIGTIPLVSGEIAEDITAYYAKSEQIPTACALGVLIDRDYSVNAAGGYLIQLLPGAPDDVIDQLESSISALGNVTSILSAGASAEDLLKMLFVGMDLKLLEEEPVSYRCYCSRERVASTLVSLGEEDLRETADRGEDITVSCQFCDSVYRFKPEDLREILYKMKT